jgi:hypothetical protein
MIPGIDDFRATLQKRLAEAEKNGESHYDVKAGDLQREVGGIPDPDLRLPTCCDAMRQTMRGSDRILAASGSGYGANLLIRYMLPRMPPHIPEAQDFRTALQKRFVQAQKYAYPHIDVQSADLHREVGHYPGSDHRMPICCDVMRQAMRDADKVLQESPSGQGASLLIRYMLPRTKP